MKMREWKKRDSLGDVKDTYAVQQLAAACSRQSEGAGPTFK